MKIAILGSGVVGQTLAAKLAERGEEVMLGTRSPKELAGKRGMGATLQDFVEKTRGTVKIASFQEAASHGEIVINATSGTASLEALKLAGAAGLDGKILIDVANPLDFSKGMPPTLTVSNTDSLGEQIQRAFPNARVVKALNTMNTHVMVDPAKVPGQHSVFICGNDTGAKGRVVAILQSFGWK